MTREEAMRAVVRARGMEDRYSLMIAELYEDKKATDEAVKRLMWDILLGVSSSNE